MATVEGTTPVTDSSLPLNYSPVPPSIKKFLPDPSSTIFYTNETPPNVGLAKLADGDTVADGGDGRGQTVEVPVPRTTKEIPTAIQQRYLSQAVDEAVAQMDFGNLTGKQVTLSIAGVMPMSDMDLGGYIRQSLVSRIALSGGRVVEKGDTEIIIRVGESGLDKIEETKTRTEEKQHNLGVPKAMMIVGGGLILTGTAGVIIYRAMTPKPYDTFTQDIGASVLVITPGLGIGLGGYFASKNHKKNPHTHTITTQATVYHMRVSMDATIIPQQGTATTTHGEADLPITEDGAL